MTAFIAAEPLEFRGLERRMQNLRRWRRPIDYFATGTLTGYPVVLAANGPGARLVNRAIQELERSNLDTLVSIGYCGALDPALCPGEIFFASEVRRDGAAYPAGGHDGVLVSMDRVITSADEKMRLRESGARAVDMEAGQVAACAKEYGLPFFCIRVVTDTAQEDLPIDFNRMRDASGRFSRARIMARACLQPFRIFPALFRFHQRCQSSAISLGDFIADNEF